MGDEQYDTIAHVGALSAGSVTGMKKTFAKLGFRHRTMMRLLHTGAKALPEEERGAEVRAMLETYGRRVGFVDFDTSGRSLRPCRQAGFASQT